MAKSSDRKATYSRQWASCFAVLLILGATGCGPSRVEQAKQHCAAGVAMLGQMSFDAAMNEFNAAIELDPKSAEAFEGRGCTQVKLKQYDGAIDDFDEALELNPRLPNALTNRALVLSLRGDYDEALVDLDLVLKDSPNSLEPLFLRADALLKLERWADAEEALTKSLDGGFQEPGVYFERGLARFSQQKTAKALEDLNESLRQDPESVRSLALRGLVLQEMGNLPAATADFAAAARLEPDNREHHTMHGVVLMLQGDHVGALAAYERAAALQKNSTTLSDRALAHWRLGHYAEAVRDYRAALAENSDEPLACDGLAQVLSTCPVASFRNGAEAITLAEHACDTAAGAEPGFLATLAAAYAESGDFKQAVARQKDSIALINPAGDRTESLQRLSLYEAGLPFRVPPAP